MEMSVPRKLWEHPDPSNTNMARFMREVNKKRGLSLRTFTDLHAWSVGDNREQFWADFWAHAGIIHEGTHTHIVEPHQRMDRVPRWFTGVRLNFAENILFSASSDGLNGRSVLGKENAKIAVTEVREGNTETRDCTWGELRERVGRLASAMKEHGVRKGDRIAVVASNSIDTLSVFLAITSFGGLFSSSSTDMGANGVLDRLTQIKPAWLFMDDGALYNGKEVDLREKMAAIVKGMEGIEEFKGVVALPRWKNPMDLGGVKSGQTLQEYLKKSKTNELVFERLDFSDPFLVVYSSGTSGQPKCIVHSVGGVVLSSKKESILHKDWNSQSVVLQFTTTGWIVYLTCILSLLQGVHTILYDGSPFLPDLKMLIKLIANKKVTNLGISPRYLQTLATASIIPRDIANLNSLRIVTCTGTVLPDSLFEWFYDTGFPMHVQLANVSGGTDIAGTFVTSNPLLPVYVGGCQGPCVGIPVGIYDSTVGPPTDGQSPPEGQFVEDGIPGELVATKAFPNMPVMFWGDDGGKRYFDAYFARYDNTWAQGDFIQKHPLTGQVMVLGRADGVLNPSGVRFGSAEIYNVIDKNFGEQIVDSICVGQRRPHDVDESVFLFLKLQPGTTFSDSLISDIKTTIGRECSKRHVPKYIFEIPEIPTTVNGKKVELPVKQIISGRGAAVKPSGTLLNPKSLEFFRQFEKIEELQGSGVSGNRGLAKSRL